MSKENNPYKRCKYLDNLGFKITEYGTNWVNEDEDERGTEWKEQRKIYGFDDRETWSMDTLFIEWIYTRFKRYKEIAIVDLDFHKFKYFDKEITQNEAIDIILQFCENYLITAKESFFDTKWFSEEEGKLLMNLMPYMWW